MDKLTLLKNIIKEKELLTPTPIRGGVEIISTLVLLLFSYYYISIISPIIFLLLLLIIFSRSMFLIHDIQHCQYFKNKKINKKLSLIFEAILGNSPSWWASSHLYIHHRFANVLNKDPDLEIFKGAFKNYNKTKINIYLFYFSLFFTYWYFIFNSWKFIIKKKLYNELYILFFNIFFIQLPIIFYFGLLYLVIFHLIFGFWIGLSFAINHLGKTTYNEEDFMNGDRLQIHLTTTRSIKYNYIIFWLLGGLNSHIEHHIFPSASRFKLNKIQQECLLFCKANKYEYNEYSIIGAIKDIFK